MDGFTTLPKMQCFKTGGSVKAFTKRDRKETDSDMAQDKAIVKKALAMHDKQEHPGEKTDLSKLRKGGRAKKCGGGSVSRYKAGGSVENAYGAKKTDKDMKDIANTKRQKPTKLCMGGNI